VFSGKQSGTRVRPEMVLPIFVLVVLFVGVLVSYPWPVLTVGTLCYLAALPLGWLSYRRYERAAAATSRPAEPVVSQDGTASGPDKPASSKPSDNERERPHRLN
jgi:CDP-diacylglycerol---serine O-phosphatidyltransferase